MATLEVLDVGHGNATLVQADATMTVVDTGRGTHLLERLTEIGVRTVRLVIISHADDDHFRGLIGLMGHADIHVDEIWVNPDSSKETQVWRDLVYELDARGGHDGLVVSLGVTTGRILTVGDSNVAVRVLAPRVRMALHGAGSRSEPLASNTMSIVVGIEVDGAMQVLLPGDLDEHGLEELLDEHQNVTAPVLVFPHHGGRPGPGRDGSEFAEALVKAVCPQTVIFSQGREQGGPRPEIVETLLRLNAQCRIACTQLSQQCAAVSPEGPFDHLGSPYAAGRRRGHCCAGTIEIDLGANEIRPSSVAHGAFISASAPDALCRRTIGLLVDEEPPAARAVD